MRLNAMPPSPNNADQGKEPNQPARKLKKGVTEKERNIVERMQMEREEKEKNQRDRDDDRRKNNENRERESDRGSARPNRRGSRERESNHTSVASSAVDGLEEFGPKWRQKYTDILEKMWREQWENVFWEYKAEDGTFYSEKNGKNWDTQKIAQWYQKQQLQPGIMIRPLKWPNHIGHKKLGKN